MPIDIIVGGQGGDEGKGKIAAYLSINKDYSIAMRVSCAQAGHSIYHDNQRLGLALVPSAFINKNLRLLIGTGSYISVEKILKEIKDTKLTPERLGIDYKATVVTEKYKEEERGNENLMNKIGSVGTGVGPCRRDKVMRLPIIIHAKDIEELKPYLTDTKREIYSALEKKQSILLEGDHGAKLDLIHGEYPCVTSRIVNASGFLGEAGIGPREARDIYVVLKPYTTRVGPGPLEEEIFNPDILDWAHTTGGETGTVSKRLRRLGKFEWENVKETIKMNSATKIAITHLDCPDFIWNALGYENSEQFLNTMQEKICNQPPYPKISLLSYGPKEKDIVYQE